MTKHVPSVVPRAAGWIGFAGIVILSLLPGSDRPHTGMSGQLEHVIAYLMTAAAFALGYRDHRARISLLILLTLSAAILETAQIWVPGRKAYFWDYVSSSLGAAIGILGLAVLQRLVNARGWRTKEPGLAPESKRGRPQRIALYSRSTSRLTE